MDERLKRAIGLVPGWRREEISLERLDGGITNHNYRVRAGGSEYVLRVGGSTAKALGIDRHRELAAMRSAEALGIGAQVVFADPDEDVLVTRFISGSPLDPRRLREDPAQLDRVAMVIRRFHGGPEIPGTFSAFDTVERYHRAALDRGVGEPRRSRGVGLARRIASRLAGATLQPCHNDLLPANILDDGKSLRVIDWEYAAMGDPYFDLGNFCANAELAEDAQQRLLMAYLGGPVTAPASRRLRQMMIASDLREAFWGWMQCGASDVVYDFNAYAERHVDRALSRIDPTDEAWEGEP